MHVSVVGCTQDQLHNVYYLYTSSYIKLHICIYTHTYVCVCVCVSLSNPLKPKLPLSLSPYLHIIYT